ncbi:MAG: sensor histidine kinase [Rhizobiaceae bacterium]
MSVETSIRSDKIIVDKTKRSSATSRFVKDIRGHLNSSNSNPVAFEEELMRSFAENHRNAFIAMPVFAAIVALILANFFGYAAAVWWFMLASLSHGLMALMSSRYLAESKDENVIAKWRTSFILVQLLIAISWTILALYSCKSCGTTWTFPIIQFSTILVFQAITMMLSYGFRSSILITSGPPTLGLAAQFIMTLQLANLVMAVIIICSQVFFFLLAGRFKLSVLSILEHKSENETLIAELETARSISEEARRRAEEANLAKSRFLATMSHELRTPLNAILGFSEVMQAEVLGPIGNDTYKDYVNDINKSGMHLLNVINEILDLSRIEAGRQELVEEAIRLDHVVDEAIAMLQLKAKNKGISIQTQFQDALPQIWADERAVRQITLNLVSNALKFAPTGGAIWVKVGWTSTGGQYLSVKDNGPGIPEEEIPIVLSSFGQGSIAIKSAEQGTGLGLPIVQALMHMHNGKFELKSRLREGTEVIATFPRSRVLEIMPPVVKPGSGKPGNRKARPFQRTG